MKSIRIAILSILMIAYMAFVPMYAYAMDMVYVNNPEIWYSDSRIISMPEQNLENYSGIYSYYADVDNACFYLHISYSEKNLKEENNDIKVEIQISNNINSYVFKVDENGIVETDSEIRKSFDTACNFGEATRQGQEIYLGIEFKNKADKTVDNMISFSVVVNGKAHNLTNGILLPLYKEETTKEKRNEKTTAVKETKNKTKNTTVQNKTSKATTEKTTKFKYIASPKSNRTEKYKADEVDEVYEIYSADDMDDIDDIIEMEDNNVEILTEEESDDSTLSSKSKILIAVAVATIIIGIVIMIYCCCKTQKAKKNEDKTEE